MNKEYRGQLKILYCNHDLILSHMAEAIVVSELPMTTCDALIRGKIEGTLDILKSKGLDSIRRKGTVKNLGNAVIGSGHDCFLKGIIFNAVISAPSYWYPQMQRYHFIDIISSQSKMHKITEMDFSTQCIPEVSTKVIDHLNELIEIFNNVSKEHKEDAFRKIIANCPMGLCLTCGITTNYLQLKGMYNQRKNHKLAEWSEDFVEWAESLPYFKELCLANKDVK